MNKVTKEQLRKHIKTHSENAVKDVQSIHALESFLRYGGKIITDLKSYDKWPNIDGNFELVTNPNISRSPKARFVVQVKGTASNYEEKDGCIIYRLNSLCFPAYLLDEVSSDPGIIFVVLHPGERGKERFFYKYMSNRFLNSINFDNDSMILTFDKSEEIFDTDESFDNFVQKLDLISDHNLFVNKLKLIFYDRNQVQKIIERCNKDIENAIDDFEIYNETRDNISQKILIRLDDLCNAVIILNAIEKGYEEPTLGTAWEIALESINTKFLSSFLESMIYLRKRVPDEEQAERLMLKYYDFLWATREYLNYIGINILQNLEKFPRNIDNDDIVYYELVSKSIDKIGKEHNNFSLTRYYIQKRTTFYVGKKRYYEYTLQLAGKYATKFNRITVYSNKFIYSNYSIQIAYNEADILLWKNPSKIIVVTDWRVSIDPSVINKFSTIFGNELRISSQYGEYNYLMQYLTLTGNNLLDIVDFTENKFDDVINNIFNKAKTNLLKDLVIMLRNRFSNISKESGHNVIRYALLRLREEIIENIIPHKNDKLFPNRALRLNGACALFDQNPILYNLPRMKTHGNSVSTDVIRAVGRNRATDLWPYVRLKYMVEKYGEIYFLKDQVFMVDFDENISKFNSMLTDADRQRGVFIKEEDGLVCIDAYERDSINILNELIKYTDSGNDGQEYLNKKYVKENLESMINNGVIDDIKSDAMLHVFVNSKLLIIYGAAGTGKTTLLNHISNLMSGRKKLFLAMTHAALHNLQKQIDAPGLDGEFLLIDNIKNSDRTLNYDIFFIDECSTVDNRSMLEVLRKIPHGALLVLAGDIYQIDSIDFGNWFSYAKEIVDSKAIVELNNTWRTDDKSLLSLWNEVRYRKPLIVEKLVIDGPYSENIGENLFNRVCEDEIVLCLNYDGRYGLNNINSYFQDANNCSEPFYWGEWKYKVGDPVLFNESRRFPQLYNNLKGKIYDIIRNKTELTFVVDVDTILTQLDVRGSYDLDIIETFDKFTRVKFTIFENQGGSTEEEREDSKMCSIVPFQLAYAVSIHKSQGLEYDSVKIVIPNSNSELINHGIFYTAITRAKKYLKIFWSAETMNKIVQNYIIENNEMKSLNQIKKKCKA